MQTNLLPIKHVSQEHPAGCLAACLQMALAHVDVHRTQRQLNTLLGLTTLGKPMSKVKALHERQFQCRKVEVMYERGSQNLIGQQLERKLPVILFVRTGELQSYWQQDTQHAVLCIGYDDANVYLNDPAFIDTPQQVSWDELMLAWVEFDYMFAVVSATSYGNIFQKTLCHFSQLFKF